MRREVFFFAAGDVALYGSLFRAENLRRPLGLVACTSWGVEADRIDPLVRHTALAAARAGGAGMVFHYPGYGDSHGDLAALGFDDLADSVCEAVREASRRCPEVRWGLAGFVFGAAVACLAQDRLSSELLLLVQPALRPSAYLERLLGAREPLAPGPSPREMHSAGDESGVAYGYPVPDPMVGGAATADARVRAALLEFDGRGVVIGHGVPGEPDLAPERFERRIVTGNWRFASQNNLRLAGAITEWLA